MYGNKSSHHERDRRGASARELFSTLAALGLLLVPIFLTGCYAGVVGLVAGIVALTSDEGGDERTVSPLRVRNLSASYPAGEAGEELTRDEIVIRFELAGGRSRAPSARVEYWIVQEEAGLPGHGPHLATLKEGPNPIRSITPGEVVERTWDARADLEDRSAPVRVEVIPFEEGNEGEPAMQTLPVGNTPPTIESVVLGLAEDRLLATFVVRDAENDPVDIESISIAWLEEGEDFGAVAFIPLPEEIFEDDSEFPPNQREDLPSSPEGTRSSFSLRLTALAGTPLDRLAEPGFVGLVRIRLGFRDFPLEALVDAESSPFLLDTNDPPQLTLLPIDDLGRLQSGVIPIRYRLFDRQGNRARLRVEVDLGEGFRRANEFPSEASDPTEDLATDDPARTFTFLWDALSQLEQSRAGSHRARLRVCAMDREEDCSFTPELTLSFSWIVRRETFDTGQDPVALESADFNGDQFSDLVIAHRASDTVSWLLGSPGGLQWSGEVKLPAGSRPAALAGGDFNDDGKDDVLVANEFASTVSFFEGNSTGLACEGGCPVDIGEDALEPRALLAAHLDADLILDAAVANLRSDNVSILKGGGDGLQWVKNVPVGMGPAALGAGDFDGDGSLDLVVTNERSNTVSFLTGSPDIESFGETAVSFPVGAHPFAVVAEDFDQDGFVDAVAANLGGSEITLFLGSAAGIAGPESTLLPTGRNPKALAVGDFDGDGKPDLATADSGSGSITYFRGGPGGLTAERSESLFVGVRPWALETSDVDGDGFPDLLVADNSSGMVQFLRGQAGGLKAAGEEVSGSSPVALSLGDHDGDGSPDAASANEGSGSVTWFRGGPPILRRVGELRAGLGPVSLTSGDYDADGFPDLLTANRQSDDVTRFGGGLEGLRLVERIEGLVAPLSMVSGDFDGKPPMDALVANSTTQRVTFLQGSSGGSFLVKNIQVVTTTFFGSPVALASSYFDGDRFPDAVVVLSNATVGFMKGLPADGDFGGGFREPVPNFPVGTDPRGLATYDFDKDTRGVLVANAATNSVSLFRGDPGNGLSPAGEIRTGTGPEAIVTGDFDGDGKLDALVANRGSGDVTYLTGTDSGPRRVEPAEIQVGGEPVALAPEDFDGDGFLDVLVTSLGSSATLLRGGPEGLIAGKAVTLSLEASPRALWTGDLDGDGFPDVLLAAPSSGLMLLRGSAAGLARGGSFETGMGPAALLGGDFDRDGFLEVVSADSGSGAVSYFRQLYLTPHASKWIEPGERLAIDDADDRFPSRGFERLALCAETQVPGIQPIFELPRRKPGDVQEILDPRFPPHYGLEIPDGVLGAPAQVTMIPGPIFDLPQEEAHARGTFLQVVADPVTILRESITLNGSAVLTLRLRDTDVALLDEARSNPHRLRIFRRDPVSKRGVPAGGPPAIVGGCTVRFAIEQFGSYITALERVRPSQHQRR